MPPADKSLPLDSEFSAGAEEYFYIVALQSASPGRYGHTMYSPRGTLSVRPGTTQEEVADVVIANAEQIFKAECNLPDDATVVIVFFYLAPNRLDTLAVK